jgi:hypothetical protein
MAGPIAAAVESTQFQPLPGLPTLRAPDLREGDIRDFHAIYGGLGSGRLVIAGAPGAGKSGAVVLLVIAALKHREQVSGVDRPKVPVPVMFTLHGWDPARQQVRDWLVVRLQQTYPLFAGKRGAQRAASLLAAGKVAVILDGLDEISEQLRPIALRALGEQATFRLIVLARSAEMAATASRDPLEGAVALELQDIDSAIAAEYLTHVQVHPAPPRWRDLTGQLRRAPDSPLAQALSTPLTLTLVRDTYRHGDDVRELLDFCDAADRRVTSEDIVDHLLDKVVPAAYTERPGEPPLRYDLHTAQHALRWLAARMDQGGTRDLQWWRIRDWAPAAPRYILSGVIGGVGAGVAVGLTTSPAFGLVAGVSVALVVGLALGFRERQPSLTGPRPLGQVLRPSSVPAGLAIGLPAGLAVGLLVGLGAGVSGGLAVGLTFGLTVALATWFSGVFSQHDVDNAAPQSPLTSWRSSRAVGLVAGLVGGAVGGLALGLADGLEGALAAGIAGGLITWLALWRVAAPVIGLASGLVVGLAIGLAAALLATFTGEGALGLTTGLIAGLLSGIVLGPAAGLSYTRTWPATLAFAQLALRWHTPIRFMRFLEDARDRNVLRTVGPIYQFRHARLQDRLAEQAVTPVPAQDASKATAV